MPDVILPVLDEAAAIPWVLRRMPAGYRPIVVDNGSTDGSGDLAASLGAVVVREPRRGFGAACFAGLEASTDRIVCFMDCDGSLDPADLPSLTEPLASGEADLVLGERVLAVTSGASGDAKGSGPGGGRRGSWPLHARLANRVLAREVRRRTGTCIRDLGPMRAAPRAGLVELDLADRRSGWPLEMVLKAAAEGWRITGVPVSYLPREGRSKVTGTLRGTIRAVLDMGALLR